MHRISGPVKSSEMNPSTAARAKNSVEQSSARIASSSSVVSGAAVMVIVVQPPLLLPPARRAGRGHDLRPGFGDQDCLFESSGANAGTGDVPFDSEGHAGHEHGVVVRRER